MLHRVQNCTLGSPCCSSCRTAARVKETRRQALGFVPLTKPMLHLPTSSFSHPFPVAHVLAGEKLQSKGLPGAQRQMLALQAGGAPLLPFQRETEKTL